VEKPDSEGQLLPLKWEVKATTKDALLLSLKHWNYLCGLVLKHNKSVLVRAGSETMTATVAASTLE
jgi:hypothetical protein